MNDSIDLPRRKLLGGVAGLGIASAGAGAGTFAYWSSEEVSEANTLAAGDLSIDLSDGNEGIEYEFTGVYPGWWESQHEISVTNTGTVGADHVQIDVENDETDVGSGADEAMAYYIELQGALWRPAENSDLDSSTDTVTFSDQYGNPVEMEDVNGNGYLDLEDFAHPDNADALNDLPPPVAGGEEDPDSPKPDSCNLEFSSIIVREEMGNAFQGATLETDIQFALHQDDSQEIDD